MMHSKRPTVLDLFSGAGGMALGFRAAGARCVGAIEKDEAAALTFARNFADDSPLVLGGELEGDVSTINIDDLLRRLPSSPDLIAGGPPCQGFSRVGRAKQASLLDKDLRILRGGVRDPDRNQLYRYFLGAVAAARPKAFVMENVPGMRELLGVDHAGRIAREAQALGYNVRYFLLNAAWYGVPQERWRLFFVGMRADLGPGAVPAPPLKTHASESCLSDGTRVPEDPLMIWGDGIPHEKRLKKVTTAFQALGDLPRLTSHLSDPSGKLRPDAKVHLPYRRRPSRFARMMKSWPGFEASDTVTGHWYRSAPRDFDTFARMAQGDRYPEALRVAEERVREAVAMDTETDISQIRSQVVPPYRNDAFADKWRKLKMDAPSWTLTAHLGKDTYSHIHYDSRQARMITIREAARLQSFPDGFEFEGNHGQAFRQIGNAVPPLLSKALALQVLDQLSCL